jgi:uncharacterized protein (TIGR04255 family)
MTVERPADLPQFDNPPIDEVVLGLQYAPIPNWNDTSVARYRSAIETDFPTIQYQPRLDTPVEQLTGLTMMAVFPAGQPPPLGRTWLINSEDDEVIQLQNDRFFFNWRHRQTPYPRFGIVHQKFWQRYGQLKDVLQAEGLPLPQPQQVEITYINWIRGMSMPEFLLPASSTRLSLPMIEGFPEQQQWAASYLIRRGSTPIARLALQCSSAMRLLPDNPSGTEPQFGVQFVLVARAPLPPAPTDEQITELMQVGRSAIVRVFNELTTPEAHDRWVPST